MGVIVLRDSCDIPADNLTLHIVHYIIRIPVGYLEKAGCQKLRAVNTCTCTRMADRTELNTFTQEHRSRESKSAY